MKRERLTKKISFGHGKTMPWPVVLDDFDNFSSINPQYEPMRELVYDLYSCASTDLHVTQTMGGNLLLSPEEQLQMNDNVLLVSYRPKAQLFHFEHRTITKMDDSKDVPIAETWNTLRLFVGYKFGLRLPETRPKAKMTKLP